MNSSSPWASERNQLRELFDCRHTGAVTTRTATLTGFRETSEHTVALTNESISSVNSYGYSPHALSAYIDYVDAILASAPEGSTKPFILSITSSSPISLASMLDSVQTLRAKFRDGRGMTSRVGIELNTSCPNIRGSPPPAYHIAGLIPILDVLARYFWEDPTLVIGLKLPPYVYSTQFDELLHRIATYSRSDPSDASRRLNPFAFLTSTNTLGQTLFFAEQAVPLSGPDSGAHRVRLAHGSGGMAGEALHPLALGNVYTLRRLLDTHEETSLRDISIIGVGGVTTRAAHVRMRRAGASVVACATILVREGVSVFEKISYGYNPQGDKKKSK
ncbi:FMN-linked oxidoreductase [Russula dissimulans]|nr:FMN-linked oxidoreductase [Russula dissimulans]